MDLASLRLGERNLVPEGIIMEPEGRKAHPYYRSLSSAGNKISSLCANTT